MISVRIYLIPYIIGACCRFGRNILTPACSRRGSCILTQGILNCSAYCNTCGNKSLRISVFLKICYCRGKSTETAGSDFPFNTPGIYFRVCFPVSLTAVIFFYFGFVIIDIVGLIPDRSIDSICLKCIRISSRNITY